MIEILYDESHVRSPVIIIYSGISDLVMLHVKTEAAAGRSSGRECIFNGNIVVVVAQGIHFDVKQRVPYL